ncbi:hypothetical protein EDD90_7375 [Streptomyces sp. Ag109_O5-1]|uniref:hypothetical protein n=1 Tax=Streptomyces sp. Ag109_O5-1 TaxID=1938851 RepID=UPI000F4E7706|nr:hypothetical protein [Streptomyces sp. Ag109_O5-1]RPE44145.1 hypothetical protein EDD90_7375 [Streptomyces sp. Ag109_O5-1]
MKKTTAQQIADYQRGAARSRALQLRMQADGQTVAAEIAAESVDANLDAINTLTAIEQGDQQ